MKKKNKIKILWWLDYALTASAPSGVQNVALQAGRALGKAADIDYIKWDSFEGQPRYLSQNDLNNIYGDNLISANHFSQKRNYKFWDTVQSDRGVWLIVPEIPFHMTDGNMKFSKMISQCRDNKVKVAVIYYDLIPLRLKEYSEIFSRQLEYTIEALRSDAIICISNFTKNDLLNYIQGNCNNIEADTAQELLKKISAVPICADYNCKIQNRKKVSSTKKTILLVGTIEPRKQQVRFLQIFNKLLKSNNNLAAFQIKIFGSLHPGCAKELEIELEKNKNIHYYRYADKELINAAYDDALFSVFISKYEGFGLPIIESLQKGVPCLTGNQELVKEVAGGSGCLMVDINNDHAIAAGIQEMASNIKKMDELRNEIKRKKFRKWHNYAADIIKLLSQQKEAEDSWNDKLNTCLKRWLKESSRPFLDFRIFDLATVIFFNIGSGPLHQFKKICASANISKLVIIRLSGLQISKTSRKHLEIALCCDILLLPSSKELIKLKNLAMTFNLQIPFPATIIFINKNIKNINKKIFEKYAEINGALKIKQNESTLLNISKKVNYQNREYDLAIIISTYNREKFVCLNVSWILNLIAKYYPNVVCVVVDNSSEDNTEKSLMHFLSHPNFRYVCNPQNVGMLGNLRVCASQNIARYHWIIGDDDFIHPGAIKRTLDVINHNPSIPFIFHNFSVYYRECVNINDSAEVYINESNIVGRNCDASGLLPVNKIAEQHDNLFTAIYPIVFRQDIASACFNYTFDGQPFDNITESVPTSKIILGSYRFATGFWFKEIGISGNAHNSWAGHRPRWHLIIMPQVLELARTAGVDSHKVWRWMQMHFKLFKESVEIAKLNKAKLNLNTQEIFNAEICFRQKIYLSLKDI